MTSPKEQEIVSTLRSADCFEISQVLRQMVAYSLTFNEVCTMSEITIKNTPLSDYLESIGGRMVDFAGWNMAVNFADGIKQEHLWTRTHAGLFDVSHMGQIELRGSNVAQQLEQLVPCDVQNLPVGKARYTQFTNNEGGVMDDLIISNADNHWYLVVNASMFDQDIAHLRAHLDNVQIDVRYDRTLIALQGPKAEAIMQSLCPAACELFFMETTELTIQGTPCRISRLGYTGEDGFELAIPQEQAQDICALLLEHSECKPTGLGARDSLRLEAGLCLYGNDLNPDISPIEAGLIWSIQKPRRAQGSYPGFERIKREIEQGTSRKLIGIKPDGKAPARSGCDLLSTDGSVIGNVSSGGFSPSLEAPICMGYVDSNSCQTGSDILIQVRNKQIPAKVVDMPFVKQSYKRK